MPVRLHGRAELLHQLLPFPHLGFPAFRSFRDTLLRAFGQGDVTRPWLLPCSELHFSEPLVGLQELNHVFVGFLRTVECSSFESLMNTSSLTVSLTS
jgi:hypothetical protein